MNAALWLVIGVASLTAAAQAAAGEGGEWTRRALAQAITASRDIPDPFHRAQALAEIAEAQIAAGGDTAALSLLQEASALTGNIDTDALASWARHDVALAFVKAGDITGAEATSASINDPRLRDDVLAAMVDARRADREYASAVEFARRMQDVARQGRALRNVVINQAAFGDVEDALRTARSITDPTAGALALGDVATSLAKEGDFREARSLAVRIRDELVRCEVLMEIASTQALSGDINGSLAAARTIDDKLARAEALAHVGAARVKLGAERAGHELFDQALELARSVRGNADRKGITFVEIARAQMSVRDAAGAQESLQLALASLKSVKRASERLTLVAQIVPMQARMGDHASAMVTAAWAEDPSLRPLLIRDVATSQAEAGDVDGARKAAGALDDRSASAAAFFGILRVQSQAHDSPGMQSTIEQALKTIRVMRSDELRAGALSALAAAQLVAGDEDAANALYDEAMAVAARAEAGTARAGAYARIADALAEYGR